MLVTRAEIRNSLCQFLTWIIAPCKFFSWILIIHTVEQGQSERNSKIALTIRQGQRKCAVDSRDFIATSVRHDCCSSTMCFQSVSLHSGPIDEPALHVDARVSTAGCAACLEIDSENLLRMFLI